ncbi:MAG: MotA/TolQ/ExbB proton channel family protein [Hellea sp.]|nr:MotA/TolQ/ExbB proton channel family protein [Hellea sp.]
MATVVLATTALLVTAPAQAQSIQSISDLLNDIRNNSAEVDAQNREREAKFQAQANQRSSLLAEARQQQRQLESRANAVRGQLAANDNRIAELNSELEAATGEFKDVFGISRNKATEFKSLLDNSIITAEYPNRIALLDDIATSPGLPTPAKLNGFYELLLDEIRAQREVKTFSAKVANMNGGEPTDVVRVGAFAIFTEDGGQFLNYTPTSKRKGQLALSPPKRPLGGAPAKAAKNVANASPGEVVVAPIDPTRGTLVATFDRYPTMRERVNQGGWIGMLIIILLAVGVIFGILNILRLFAVSSSVRAQKRKSTPGKNPLGRIMAAYEKVKNRDGEVVELALDEAILKESPKLERGLSLLKLGAGIAPLMGLLGTVTGMIKTFQAMTIFGTGDAQKMASGISEALVTTMLGLIAAIPLLILHSFCASLARGVQSTLEEQSAGIVARHVEEGRGA